LNFDRDWYWAFEHSGLNFDQLLQMGAKGSAGGFSAFERLIGRASV
jgi:hypothetical protein